MEFLAEEHGPWQDNLLLKNGLYTVTEEVTLDQERLSVIVRTAVDAMGGTLEGCRVLDIGSAESLLLDRVRASRRRRGGLSEGRRTNVAKARFLKDALSLDSLEIVHDDVREFFARDLR